MKRHLFFVVALFHTLGLFAQSEDNTSIIISQYDKKVEENFQLRNEVNRLRRDSAQFEEKQIELLADSLQRFHLLCQEQKRSKNLSKQLGLVQHMLDLCRQDSVTLQQQLEQCNPDSIQRYEDSIAVLNKDIKTLTSRVSHLSTLHAQNTWRIQEQSQELATLDTLVNYLDGRFSGKSVDKLYHSTNMGELAMCVELYHHLGKSLPANIQKVMNCFEAEQLVNTKYDQWSIKQYLVSLPQDTSVGKAIAQRLQNYAAVNAGAQQLWEQIHKDVCFEEIPNEDFRQVQSKRQIWQRTQKFLNHYPTLATDYPYIFDQLQSMLRQIWDNANNFNAIANPFE